MLIFFWGVDCSEMRPLQGGMTVGRVRCTNTLEYKTTGRETL